jgi:hypothetical protein
MGLLFIAFLITIIIGAILATAGDELRALWLKVIDTLHHSPAEQYYKQLRNSPAGGVSRALKRD